MAVTQSHIPTISDAVVELDLSNLGTFTAQNTITVQGEITEVAVSGGDLLPKTNRLFSLAASITPKRSA